MRSRKRVTFIFVVHIAGMLILLGAIVPMFFAALEYQTVAMWFAFGLVSAGVLYNTLGVGYYGRELGRLSEHRGRTSR